MKKQDILRYMLVLSMFVVTLYAGTGNSAALAATDDSTVVYDASDFTNLKGRTQEDVLEQYNEALEAGDTYVDGDSSTYYDTPASTSAPYAAGVLSSDTLKSMAAMTNFYRWLIGVEDMSVNTTSDTSMQAQALDRNFQFDHYISNDSKPEDMDDETWNEGFTCTHNILAAGGSPRYSVTLWLNEGYSLSYNSFGVIGHRTAILNSAYSGMTYGYSGKVATGKIGASGNSFTNAFAAFPAAGYMPNRVLSYKAASWTVELNTDKVKAENTADVVITVTNETSGDSYTCTTSNGYAQVSSSFLNFRQPSDVTSGSYYTDSYEVTVTGLTDVATGNAAKIHYEVNFFDPNETLIPAVSLSQTSYAYTGSDITPAVTVGDGTLTEGTDYTVTYYNNVEEGQGVVCVKGIGAYSGVRKKAFKIIKDTKDISLYETSLYYTIVRYTGAEKKPAVTIVAFDKTLVKDTDYTVTYENNLNPGIATVTITGIGEYSGTVTKIFSILKGYQAVTSLKISSSTIEVGGTETITAAGHGTITYSSSDESIATVDEDGTVHGIAEGTAVLTVKASGDEYYDSQSRTITVTVSKDHHSMVEDSVTYGTDDDPVATVHETCSVCGATDEVKYTTMDSFSLWYRASTSSTMYSAVSKAQNEFIEYIVSLRSYSPTTLTDGTTAIDTSLVLSSSDTDVMTVSGNSFKFVGVGTVTLTIAEKYRPTTKRTVTFTVSHVLVEGDIVLPATCAKEGMREYTCSICEKTILQSIPIDSSNHTGETALKDAKDATCGADGYTGDTVCAGCGVVLKEGTVIPATGNHDYKWADTKTATCVEEGEKTGT